MKTKTEKLLWCKACEKAYRSNRKKKCCDEPLEEVGFMEVVVSMKDDTQTANAN